MARTPQRSGRWSLRQVALEAGVSLATARSAVRSGHLDPASLTAHDVLVLKVAAMLPALQPLGELRPANAPREVPRRDVEAIKLVRAAGTLTLPEIATLVVTAAGAELAHTFAEVKLAAFEAAEAGQPYLALPVGKWALELASSAGREAAA